MTTRAIATWVAGLVLAAGTIAAPAAPRIDIFGSNPDIGLTDFGKCEDFVAPRGLPMVISLFVGLGGMQGISGAEFFCRERSIDGREIRVFDPTATGGLGWSVSVFPNERATWSQGSPFVASWPVGELTVAPRQPSHPREGGALGPGPIGGAPEFVRRYNIVFAVARPSSSEGCQTGDADAPPGYVRLLNAAIYKYTPGGAIPNDSTLWVGPGDPPSGTFRCPLVTLCDAPLYTAMCVYGGQYLINPRVRICNSSARAPETWSSIKEMYR